MGVFVIRRRDDFGKLLAMNAKVMVDVAFARVLVARGGDPSICWRPLGMAMKREDLKFGRRLL